MPVALERNVPPAWSFPQGYRLDELFREMDLLRRVIGRGNALPGRLRPASDCIWSTRWIHICSSDCCGMSDLPDNEMTASLTEVIA
jgi:hypothetical protein